MAAFCSAQCKTKRVQSTWNLSWLFLVWLFPTAIPHSREKSKGWTSGGITECKRHWKPIWREIWTGLFQRVLRTTFSISSLAQRRGQSLSHCTQRWHSLFDHFAPVHKIQKQNLRLTATQFNIHSVSDWWYLNSWNWAFPMGMKDLMGKTGEIFKYRNHLLSDSPSPCV